MATNVWHHWFVLISEASVCTMPPEIWNYRLYIYIVLYNIYIYDYLELQVIHIRYLRKTVRQSFCYAENICEAWQDVAIWSKYCNRLHCSLKAPLKKINVCYMKAAIMCTHLHGSPIDLNRTCFSVDKHRIALLTISKSATIKTGR